MAHINKVMQSINEPGGPLCVDVFQRPDGSFGFEEFRRDPEEGSGWFRVGWFGDRVFDTQQAALTQARHDIEWLDLMVGVLMENGPPR